MAAISGELVRLYDSSSVAIDTLTTGSVVAGVVLPGLSLEENGWRSWNSTDISSTYLDSASVVYTNSYDLNSLEINGGDLSVSDYQKVLVKDNSGSYQFVHANQIEVNQDSLVKYTDNGIVEELVTSIYDIGVKTVHTIDIEDLDVYLQEGYIVHNNGPYTVHACDGTQLGCFEFPAYDPGANSRDCHQADDVEGFGPQCIYTCDPCGAAQGAAIIGGPAPCGSPGECGEADTSTGPQGPTGPKGQKGQKGATGLQGNTGGEGPQGPQGTQGSAGPAGITGPTGPSGDIGSAGGGGDSNVQGPIGPKGPTGAQGSAGGGGDVGVTGPQGFQGKQGPTGFKGPSAAAAGPHGGTGSTGPQGAGGSGGDANVQGPQGPQGPGGVVGPTGFQGVKGVIGPKGPTGVQGDVGVEGPGNAQGPQGPQGPTGVVGPIGFANAVGPQGDTGAKGPQGNTGTTGDSNVVGPQGPQGQSGNQGATGPTGVKGATGPKGPTGTQGDVGLEGLGNVTGPQGPQGATGPVGPQGDDPLSGGYFEITTVNGVTVSNNVNYQSYTVTKTGGSSNSWSSAADSRNTGHTNKATVSFTAQETNTYKMMGITTDPTSNDSYNTIDYAFYPRLNGDVYIYENGTSRGQFATSY